MGESVSFGKYENDALCWEKWSTFSPNNKYLEEVGKCSTPGSVAQKKAFFEAHYSKIAAMKAEAELLDQAETGSQQIIKEDEPQTQICPNVEQAQPEISSVVDESEHSFQSAKETLSSSNALEPLISSNVAVVDKLEEVFLVNDESMKLVKQMNSYTQQSKQDIPKMKPQNVAPKVISSKMEKNLKKTASIIPKLPSTKPKATPTSSSSSSLKSKNPSLSLHLSRSMNSDTPSSSVTTSSRRPSLFMEQMGDKDIVKRAFKTFQNNRLNQLPQAPTKESKQKASPSMTYQKENERSRKVAEKITPARGQLGPMWKSVSSGSLKGVERRIKAAPTSEVLISNERAEKRKELFKNLEEKSNAREAEKIKVGSKSKELKDGEMKRISFKAKPMPSFYGTQGVSQKCRRP